MSSYKFTLLGDDELQISESRFNAIISLLIILVFNGIWYFAIFHEHSTNPADWLKVAADMIAEDKILIVFLVAPLVVFAFMLWQFGGVMITGRVLIISKASRSISRNGVRIIDFDDIAGWKIRSGPQEVPMHQRHKVRVVDHGRQTFQLVVEDINQKDTRLLSFTSLGELHDAIDRILPYLEDNRSRAIR